MMNRRTFLKIMLGIAPGVALIGMPPALWSAVSAERPQSDPVSIYINTSGYLYEPGYDEGPVTRRVFYGIDDMSRHERYDFYREHMGEGWLKHHLRNDIEEHDDVKLSYARLGELDNSLEAYFIDVLDPGEGSFRDVVEKSRYWIGAWLYDNLPAVEMRRLGLAYVEVDEPGFSFCAVRYSGSLGQINTALFTCGLNAVCFKEA
jgi:hypothetical protein